MKAGHGGTHLEPQCWGGRGEERELSRKVRHLSSTYIHIHVHRHTHSHTHIHCTHTYTHNKVKSKGEFVGPLSYVTGGGL